MTTKYQVGDYVKVIKAHDATPAGDVTRILQVVDNEHVQFVVVVRVGRGTESYRFDEIRPATLADHFESMVNE